MRNLFSYDSPLMQILMRVGDMIILNALYLLCCLPIVTIGAAQAGLYTAAKVMMDKEDDSSLVVAFFRGFKNGFWTITAAWCIVGLLFAFVVFTGFVAGAMDGSKILIGIAFTLCALFMTLIPLFHSRFSCNVKQLFRNSALLLFMHPLRSLASLIVVWLPLALLIIGMQYGPLGYFIMLTPIWITLYFSTALLFSYHFMKKPFQFFIDEFNKANGITSAEETESPALPE